MTTEEKKKWACEQLQRAAEEFGRIPKKDDFDAVTLSRIKAFLGPWPRALEAAGLKETKPVNTKAKKRNFGKAKVRNALKESVQLKNVVLKDGKK